MRWADGWTSEEFGREEYGQNISFEFSINKKKYFKKVTRQVLGVVMQSPGYSCRGPSF